MVSSNSLSNTVDLSKPSVRLFIYLGQWSLSLYFGIAPSLLAQKLRSETWLVQCHVNQVSGKSPKINTYTYIAYCFELLPKSAVLTHKKCCRFQRWHMEQLWEWPAVMLSHKFYHGSRVNFIKPFVFRTKFHVLSFRNISYSGNDRDRKGYSSMCSPL